MALNIFGRQAVEILRIQQHEQTIAQFFWLATNPFLAEVRIPTAKRVAEAAKAAESAPWPAFEGLQERVFAPRVEPAPVGNSGDFIGLLKSDGFITLPPRGEISAAFSFTPWR